jgi:ribonuclease HI
MEIVHVQVNKAQEINKTSRTQDAEEELAGIKQGDTINNDMAIQGNKIYTDAAWKTKKSPGSEGRTATGIGVFCQLQHSSRQYKAMIQAAMPTMPSPLHAETTAFVFAVQMAEQMNISPVTFLTDNLNLAKAASAEKITDSSVPWELREQIPNYKKASKNLQAKIFHVKRDMNRVAHDCSQQAIRQSLSEPIFCCSSSAHLSSTCPLLLAFQNLHLQGIVLNVVYCR